MIRPELIPTENYKVVSEKENVEVTDILGAVKRGCMLAAIQLRPFCSALDSNDTYKDVFEFLKKEINYYPDFRNTFAWEDNEEVVKLPSALFRDRVGDCKSFTAFMAGVALNFENEVFIRLVYYDKVLFKIGSGHIYPFIKQKGKTYYLDAVNGKYNKQEKFFKKKDIKLK